MTEQQFAKLMKVLTRIADAAEAIESHTAQAASELSDYNDERRAARGPSRAAEKKP